MAWRHDPRRLCLALAWLVLAVLAIDAYVPLSPFMPRNDIDGSWIFAFNQAVARGLVFGRDLVFTFGPYASIFTRTYDPATVTRMLAGSALLALVFVLCLAVLLRPRGHDAGSGRWPALACIAFFLLLGGADSLLLALPLLATLALLAWLNPEAQPGARSDDARPGARSDNARPGARWPLAALLLAWIAFGLLPLVKGTLALLCGASALLSALLLLQAHRVALAALSLACPVIAMAAFWCVAGLALADLPGYLLSLREIVSGYSESMAVKGPSRELWLFGLPVALLLVALATQGRMPARLRGGVLVVTGLFLFLSFKAGFVRHDVHAQIALANAIAAVGFAWPLLPPGGYRSRALLVALVTFTLSCGGYAMHKATDGRDPVGGATSNALALRTTSLRPGDWQARYALITRRIAKHCQLDAVETLDSDVYSYGQSCLLAKGLPWKPRPVLQSYSAYTPALARLNEAHLRGTDAPAQLLYRLQTIDEHLPAMDDGLSLPAMLDNYVAVPSAPEWLVLKARSTRLPASRYDTPLTLQAKLGRPVDVPAALPLYAEITIRPTWAGRWRALLFKPPMLSMALTLADGSTLTHRVNAGMMESGFLLSPMLATTGDVAALFDGRLDERRRVTRIVIDSAGTLPFWQDDVAITFKRYQRPTPNP